MQVQIIFSVESNHPTLFQQVEQWFQQMQADGLYPPHVNTPLSLTSPHRHTHRLGHSVDPFAAIKQTRGQDCKSSHRGTDSSVMEQNQLAQFTSAVCAPHSPKLLLPFASIGD